MAIQLNFPSGWEISDRGLPELGDEPATWTGTRTSGGAAHRIEVLWVPTVSRYLCQYYRNASLEALEARTFHYPHELLEWLDRWVKKVEEFKG